MVVTDRVTAYAEAVIAGEVLVCTFVRLACERHLRDLERGEFVWDLGAAEIAMKFSRMMVHYKGEAAGQPFDPEPWQDFIKGSLFGWKKQDGTRRFWLVYVEIPRKNGKTYMAADVCLQGLVADNEPSAEVYSIASKMEQARRCFVDAQEIARRVPVLRSRITSYRTSLTVAKTASGFYPLSRDTKTMDGLNVHAAAGDEMHAWTDDMLYNQMVDAMGARRQPFFYGITTAGNNLEGICYKLRDHAISMLEGNEDRGYIDEGMFAYIATLDAGDDWRDEALWAKANPNLGVSKRLDKLREMVQMGVQIPSQEFKVLNKQFNIWTTTDEKWLDMDRWAECGGPIDANRLKNQPCHIGLDLSTNQDLTAAIALFPPGPYPEWVVLPRLYLPMDRLDLREREDRVPYKLWAKQGHLLTTPGDVIDMEFIKRDVLAMASEYAVLDVGFDPYRAVEISSYLLGEGLDMVEMRQGHATLGAPTLALERLVLECALRHGGHPVLRWMAANTKVIRDSNDNIRPDKKASRKRIDGIVGLVMALGRALVKIDNESVYSKRGFITDE